MGRGDRDKRKQRFKPKRGEKENVSTEEKPEDTDKQTEEENVDVSKKESNTVGDKDDKQVKAGEEDTNKPKVKFVPSLKEPEKEDRKYSRRQIVSNWKKYEEDLLVTHDDDEENTLRGADFEDVLSMSRAGVSQFRLKSEREWDEAESAFTNEFFSLDLQNLARALTCVPFHKRLRIPESCFTKQMLTTMEKDAAQHASKYVPPERTFTKQNAKPVSQTEEITKRFISILTDDKPKDKSPQALTQELNEEAKGMDVSVSEKTFGISECSGPQDGDVGYHMDLESKPVDNVSLKQVFPDASCKSEVKGTEGTSKVEAQNGGDGAVVEAEEPAAVAPETTQMPQRKRVSRRQKSQKLTQNLEEDVTASDVAETKTSEKPVTNIVVKSERKEDFSEKQAKENKEKPAVVQPTPAKPAPVKPVEDGLDFLLSLKAPVQKEESKTLPVMPDSLGIEEDIELEETPAKAVVIETSKPQSLEDWLDDFLDD